MKLSIPDDARVRLAMVLAAILLLLALLFVSLPFEPYTELAVFAAVVAILALAVRRPETPP